MHVKVGSLSDYVNLKVNTIDKKHGYINPIKLVTFDWQHTWISGQREETIKTKEIYIEHTLKFNVDLFGWHNLKNINTCSEEINEYIKQKLLAVPA